MDNEIQNDDLMEDLKEPEVHEVYFQFGKDEPIKFVYVAGDDSDNTSFSLTLKASETTEEPAITFSDGKGNEFKLFMKKSTDGVQ